MVNSYKNKFNKKYGFDKDKSHSVEQISKLTDYKLSGLKKIVKKGEGAFYSNPSSVRKNVSSPTQWGIARLYSAVMGGKAQKVDQDLLIKKPQKTHIMPNGDIHTGATHTKNSKLIKKGSKTY